MNTLRTVSALAVLVAVAQAHAGTATYLFNNSLLAQQGGAPSLTAVNPANANSYGTASLYGAIRTTYNTSGTTGALANNAGLLLDGSSLVTATHYTLEMVVALDQTDGYRKLADVSNTVSDLGYYVLNQNLDLFNNGSATVPSPATIAPKAYNYLALTVDNGTVKGYVNGAIQFSYASTVMDGNMFDFFLDDQHTGGGEYSNVSVALLRVQDSVLTDAQIGGLANNPFQAVPEPTTVAALGLGFVAVLRRRKASISPR